MICEACRKEVFRVEKDHKVPRSLGGNDLKSNAQRICGDCHYRKTFLERHLLLGEPEVIDEWSHLAFRSEERSLLIEFTENLERSVSAMKQVFGLETKKPKERMIEIISCDLSSNNLFDRIPRKVLILEFQHD